MEIRPPIPIGAAIGGLPAETRRWLATPRGGGYRAHSAAGIEVAAVGPASGFDAEEEGAFEAAGFAPLRLADGRLRAETAAVAWAALWAAGS